MWVLLLHSGHLSYCTFKRGIQTRPCALLPGHLGFTSGEPLLWARRSCAELVFLCWKWRITSQSIQFSSCPSSYGVSCIDTKSFARLLTSVWMQFTGAGSWHLGALGLRNGMSSEPGAFSSDKQNEFSGLELHQQPFELQQKNSHLRLRCTFHWGARSCLDMLASPAVDD